MVEAKNKKLYKTYDSWKSERYDKLISEKEKPLNLGQHLYSAPFYAGVSKFYDPAKKTLLFVGQEARNWWPDDNDSPWELERNYSVRYAQSQLRLESEFECNRSPFWRLYRNLGIKYNMVWTNIDKVHRIGMNNKTVSLPVEDELFLNAPLAGENNKTVFQREVEIINPDVVLFVTGPHYYKTMAKATSISDEPLYFQKPTPDDSVREISHLVELGRRVFWSYHPSYLSRHHEIVKVANLLNNLKFL